MSAPKTTVNVINLHGMVIRKGDTLLLATTGDARRLSDEDRDTVCTGVRELLPDVANVMLLEGLVPVAVYRPGDDAAGGP